MYFLRKIWYGLGLRKKWDRYRRAKQKAYYSCKNKTEWQDGWLTKVRARTLPVFLGGGDTQRPRSSWRKFEMRVRHYGTFENFIAKSFIGLSAGVLMTFGLYFLFAFSLNFSFTGATLSCCIVGFISTLGLAFSEYFRSIALLSLPAILSGKGRQALTAYAIILAITGPGKNTLNNIRVLTDSIACSQEKLWKALKDVGNVIKNPYLAIKQSVSVAMTRIIEVTKQIKGITSVIDTLVLSLAGVVKMAARSLDKITVICQTKAGRTYDACVRAMEAASEECRANMIFMYKGMCRSKDLSKSMCSLALPSGELCFLPSAYADRILETTKQKINAYNQRLSHLLTFKLTKSHETHYEFRKSRQVKDVLVAIATEIRGLVNSILYLFDTIAILFSFFYIFLFYSVIAFRNKYLAHEWYENRYITSNLLLIEMKRIHSKKSTIFPLSKKERQKYIKINSLNLASMDAYEMFYMIVKAVGLLIKLSLHMSTDYGLWWLIMDCRRAAVLVQTPTGMSNIEIIANKSDGLAGRIYEELTNAFQPKRFNFSTDMTSCLPEPYKPDFKRNYTIVIIGILTVLLGFLEPFGKRLKVRIMNFYYPTVARRRAVWLYNHILRTRNRFTKEARRRLRRHYGREDLREPEFSSNFNKFRRKLGCMLPCKCSKARRFLLNFNQHYDFCILCKGFGAPDDPLTECKTPGCKGTYCLECFASLQNLCTICLRPEQYNDISDISEECDSSDEDLMSLRTGGRGSSPIYDSEGSTIQEGDFDSDSDFSDYRCTAKEVVNYDTPEQLLLPSLAHGDEKESDWATMKDFTLPDSVQEREAIADHGISMTLAHRLNKGFFGLIYSKPVFGRPLETVTSQEVSPISSNVPSDDDENAQVKSARSWLSKTMSLPSKISAASKKLYRKFKKSPTQETISRRRDPRSPTTDPSYCGYDSGTNESERSFSRQGSSRMSTLMSNETDRFRTLMRPQHKNFQVYYGLVKTDSESDRSSDVDEEPNSESSDKTAHTRTSLSSFSIKKRSRASDLSTLSTIEDGSSWLETNADSKRRKIYPTDQPHSRHCTTDADIDVSEIRVDPSKIKKRPSFRGIKICPTQAQVTHNIFNIDE